MRGIVNASPLGGEAAPLTLTVAAARWPHRLQAKRNASPDDHRKGGVSLSLSPCRHTHSQHHHQQHSCCCCTSISRSKGEGMRVGPVISELVGFVPADRTIDAASDQEHRHHQPNPEKPKQVPQAALQRRLIRLRLRVETRSQRHACLRPWFTAPHAQVDDFKTPRSPDDHSSLNILHLTGCDQACSSQPATTLIMAFVPC